MSVSRLQWICHICLDLLFDHTVKITDCGDTWWITVHLFDLTFTTPLRLKSPSLIFYYQLLSYLWVYDLHISYHSSNVPRDEILLGSTSYLWVYDLHTSCHVSNVPCAESYWIPLDSTSYWCGFSLAVEQGLANRVSTHKTVKRRTIQQKQQNWPQVPAPFACVPLRVGGRSTSVQRTTQLPYSYDRQKEIQRMFRQLNKLLKKNDRPTTQKQCLMVCSTSDEWVLSSVYCIEQSRKLMKDGPKRVRNLIKESQGRWVWWKSVAWELSFLFLYFTQKIFEGLRERTEHVPQLRNWENHQ